MEYCSLECYLQDIVWIIGYNYLFSEIQIKTSSYGKKKKFIYFYLKLF